MLLVKASASARVGITNPAGLVVLETGRSSRPERAEVASRARAAVSATNHEPASSDRTSSKSKSETRKPSRPRGSPANFAGDIGRSQQRLIVEHDRHAVASELNVELPGAGPCFPAQSVQPRACSRVPGTSRRDARRSPDARAPEQQREESIPGGSERRFGKCMVRVT